MNKLNDYKLITIKYPETTENDKFLKFLLHIKLKQF